MGKPISHFIRKPIILNRGTDLLLLLLLLIITSAPAIFSTKSLASELLIFLQVPACCHVPVHFSGGNTEHR